MTDHAQSTCIPAFRWTQFYEGTVRSWRSRSVNSIDTVPLGNTAYLYTGLKCCHKTSRWILSGISTLIPGTRVIRYMLATGWCKFMTDMSEGRVWGFPRVMSMTITCRPNILEKLTTSPDSKSNWNNQWSPWRSQWKWARLTKETMQAQAMTLAPRYFMNELIYWYELV